MIVISDTGPLNYLLAIGQEQCLTRLFEEVLIPASVVAELQKSGAPPRNIEWVQRLPENFFIRTPLKVDTTLDLGAGEREAICLAAELQGASLLIDEQKARRIARGRGFLVIGTIGVIETAAVLGLLDGEQALISLSRTSFYVSDDVLAAALNRVRQRSSKPK